MNIYKPMMAQSREKPFDDPKWIFEVKWDGIRALAYIGDTISLKTRNNKELIDKFPELKELSELTTDAVLDGEIIIMKAGIVDFKAAVQRNQVTNIKDIEFQRARNPATYILFDILEQNDTTLIDLPLIERKEILRKTVKEGQYVIHSSTIENHGKDYYQVAIQHNLEGIIAKRKMSTYQPGVRSGDWLKIKRIKTVDAVVFGYTIGEGVRAKNFGALILGLYDSGEPRYIGRVGTGFTDLKLNEIKEKLDSMLTKTQWFIEADIPSDTLWVDPRLVVTVGYQQFTEDQRLRAPRFQDFRYDKPPELCTFVQVKPVFLEEYYAKRDFSITPEPIGGQSTGMENSFVIQKHQARRLHYDLRLERDGVLISWAVPKGPPIIPGEKRLAIHTEDHPIEYGGFEGIIPKGQYGAGAVEIWDKGFYVPIKWLKDKVEIIIVGERLHGRYELIKFGEPKEKNWLLFKKGE
jgi:bifunctional non-homologous end joining protein LigD